MALRLQFMINFVGGCVEDPFPPLGELHEAQLTVDLIDPKLLIGAVDALDRLDVNQALVRLPVADGSPFDFRVALGPGPVDEHAAELGKQTLVVRGRHGPVVNVEMWPRQIRAKKPEGFHSNAGLSRWRDARYVGDVKKHASEGRFRVEREEFEAPRFCSVTFVVAALIRGRSGASPSCPSSCPCARNQALPSSDSIPPCRLRTS